MRIPQEGSKRTGKNRKVIKMGRDSHQVEVEAAIVTEKQDAAEKTHRHEQKFNK
jgi:hypothetical protein